MLSTSAAAAAAAAARPQPIPPPPSAHLPTPDGQLVASLQRIRCQSLGDLQQANYGGCLVAVTAARCRLFCWGLPVFPKPCKSSLPRGSASRPSLSPLLLAVPRFGLSPQRKRARAIGGYSILTLGPCRAKWAVRLCSLEGIQQQKSHT